MKIKTGKYKFKGNSKCLKCKRQVKNTAFCDKCRNVDVFERMRHINRYEEKLKEKRDRKWDIK